MKCDTCRELLTAYLKAELDEEQRCAVEEHLATCAECAKEAEGARSVLVVIDQASDAPIIRLVNKFIQDAIESRASDIHLQPQSEGCQVRFRIDGVLQNTLLLPRDTQQYVFNRIKIMADMSLTERHRPQDGRILVTVDERDYDLRVSIVPSILGERVCMRILDRSLTTLTLDQIHLVGEQREQLDRLLHKPSGLVVVTGPTGSGKTTTLYAILQSLNSSENNLMSVEDPVEYQLDGVTQIAVNLREGVTFESAMKACLRQDPDIIMCGEIRDLRTTEMIAQAALTGHLVLSTLHTSDAVSVIRRLVDIGLPRFIIAQTLLGATAQRLLRRICPDCREEYEPTEAEQVWLQEAGLTEAPARLWRGAGCERCRHTGYLGRTAVYEVFTVDGDILNLLIKDASLTEIEKAATAKTSSMKQAAIEKILAGEVYAGEARRVLMYLPEY